MLFFGLVYVIEGIGQTGGLIAQPLSFFLKQTYGWTALQVTAYLTVLNLPWIIKPVYGMSRISCRFSAIAVRATSFSPISQRSARIVGSRRLHRRARSSSHCC